MNTKIGKIVRNDDYSFRIVEEMTIDTGDAEEIWYGLEPIRASKLPEGQMYALTPDMRVLIYKYDELN